MSDLTIANLIIVAWFSTSMLLCFVACYLLDIYYYPRLLKNKKMVAYNKGE